MSVEKFLITRSESKCELCSSSESLEVFEVSPYTNDHEDHCIYICGTCKEQMEDQEKVKVNHWRCLNESMWSEVPAVQVVTWRMLLRLKSEGWPQDLLDMMYLDDETLAWAKKANEVNCDAEAIKHADSNGSLLQAGDSVILIKDLNVKGANFTAKRGTPVRRISLVADNAEQIEGKINGQRIVILTQFVKKSS